MKGDFSFCGFGLWGFEHFNLQDKAALEVALAQALELQNTKNATHISAELAHIITRYRGNPYVGIAQNKGCVELLSHAYEINRQDTHRIQKLLFLAPDSEILDKKTQLEALAHIGVELEFHIISESSTAEHFAHFGLLYVWK